MTPAVGPSPLRRLTRTEYDNAVADLLGDTSRPGKTFVEDTRIGLFDNSASAQTVPDLLADQYLDSAVELAGNIPDVNKLVGCDPASGAACVKGFIERFGRRAYRRPLSPEETTKLMAVFDQAKAGSDPPTAARAVVAGMLAAPSFLFKPEFGTNAASSLPNAKPLSQFELATRLASLLWASIPDDVLLDAAEAGKLATKAQVAEQARRMLDDPKAKAAIAGFYDQWLGLERILRASKDTNVYPQYNDALRDAMVEETRRFVADVLWNGDAKLATLFTASYSFVNKPLAEIYGVKGPADATTFAPVSLDPQQRAGILTQASMLTAFARPDQSSPVKRGQWVRVRMLCDELPEPPANIPQLPEPMDGVSNRERFAMHTNNPACSGCHNLIDGLGFGLERYDGIGRFRTTDQGVEVDAKGKITQTQDIDGEYEGGRELAELLAGSEDVQHCLPEQWLTYSLGRKWEDADTCSLVELQEAFGKSDGDMRELLVSLTQTSAFWNYRSPE